MKTVSIHDAKTNLSKYIAAVKAGETIYIGSFGKPEVKLVITDIVQPKRKLGQGSGNYWIAPDFDETDELTEMMINGPLFPDEKTNTNRH
jgi:antitoxin (DNA-binding transcriptional repressor) of toxin-antitoxin stability system